MKSYFIYQCLDLSIVKSTTGCIDNLKFENGVDPVLSWIFAAAQKHRDLENQYEICPAEIR